MNKFARIISYVGHPLLVPTYIYAMVFLIHPYYIKEREQYLILIGLIFFITFFIPTWATFFLYKLGIIKSMTMERLGERKIPFLMTSILYVVGSYLMSQATFLNKEFVVFMYSIAVNVTITGFVSTKWKISAHAVGVGGFLGILTYTNLTFDFDFFQSMYFISILGGAGVLWARLFLHAHNPKQVYTGLIGSFLICLSVPYFLI